MAVQGKGERKAVRRITADSSQPRRSVKPNWCRTDLGARHGL